MDNCIICNSKSLFLENKQNSYRKCMNCGFISKVNIPSKTDEKQRYDNHICDIAYMDYMKGVYEKIKDFIVPNKVLDFGCGKVKALETIAASDFIFDSYDLYYSNIELKKYNTIILIEVIEHLNNPLEVLKNLLSNLEAGGVFIIMTNLVEEPFLSWWYQRDITHVSFFTLDAFKYIAKSLNLEFTITEYKNIFCLKKI